MNMLLLFFDILCLPITLIRILLIYFYGSRYNVAKMKFLDVMLHSNGKYFNQDKEPTIDTIEDDIRTVIKKETKIYDINEKFINISTDNENKNIGTIDEKYINIPINNQDIFISINENKEPSQISENNIKKKEKEIINSISEESDNESDTNMLDSELNTLSDSEGSSSSESNITSQKNNYTDTDKTDILDDDINTDAEIDISSASEQIYKKMQIKNTSDGMNFMLEKYANDVLGSLET